MRQEAVVAYIKILPQHFSGETEENHKNFNQDNQSPGRDLKPGPSERATWQKS
jgi:hypothetical protein